MSKDGKRIEQWNNMGSSDSGKCWLEGDLICRQMKIMLEGAKSCSHIYRNPDGTPEKKNEYLSVGRGTIITFSPID